MIKKPILLISIGLICSYVLVSIYLSMQTTRNDISIVITDPKVNPVALKVAVIGDPHLSEHADSLSDFRALISAVKDANPRPHNFCWGLYKESTRYS